jgi:metal transporter CNNM
MGQDGIYLQVIATSGEGKEQKHAQRVYRLLKKGKHWVLVTLLLSNVIVNETLPIVLDRSLGGGWPAVLGSTVLIGMQIFMALLSAILTLTSNFWGSYPPIDMCAIRHADRRVHVSVRTRSHVPTCTAGISNCETS